MNDCVIYGYARVSTRDQNLDLQIDALTKAGCQEIFKEVAKGAKTDRPKLNELLSVLKSGDTLIIWKLDRMGRSLQHLITTFQACRHFLRNLPGHPSPRKGQKKATSMPPAALAVLVPLDFDPPSGLKIYAPQ